MSTALICERRGTQCCEIELRRDARCEKANWEREEQEILLKFGTNTHDAVTTIGTQGCEIELRRDARCEKRGDATFIYIFNAIQQCSIMWAHPRKKLPQFEILKRNADEVFSQNIKEP